MQFKKQISLFLAFFVLVSNSGLAFNVHYCEKKIASISSVFSNEDDCNSTINGIDSCCAQKEVSNKKCCSNKEINFKEKSDIFTYKTTTFDFDFSCIITNWKPIIFGSTPSTSVFQNIDYYCCVNAPPLYKLYCQFTLFG